MIVLGSSIYVADSHQNLEDYYLPSEFCSAWEGLVPGVRQGNSGNLAYPLCFREGIPIGR